MLMAIWFFCSNQKEVVDKVERNPYGGTNKRVRMTMKVEGNDEEVIEFDVSSRRYTDEEIQMLFNQAVRRIETFVTGENESLDHVDKALHFPNAMDGLPFQITWEMDRYDVLEMDGSIREEVIKEIDSDGMGVLVTVTGIFSYGDWQAVHEMTVRVCRPEEKEQNIQEKILYMIQETDTNTVSSPYLKLPEKVNGAEITWITENASLSPVIIVLICICTVLLAVREKQKKEEQIKEKKKQMIVDYPEILSQFTLLMNAGMTVRNTWQKIIEDYGKRKERTGKERAAYEEMIFTWKEMQSGISEMESYERFSRRCGVPEYRKLGMHLSQNIKKGVKGTADLLILELADVMETRKSKARQAGEEAGTKLLMPMMLMLIVVMLIVVVPAFWSVQV